MSQMVRKAQFSRLDNSMLRSISIVIVFMVLIAVTVARGQENAPPIRGVAPQTTAEQNSNWPQFRGPEGRGVGSGSLPDHWSATENVVWKTDIPGRGWSSPIVWGNRVFLTTTNNTGKSEEPKKGLYFGGDRPKPPEAVHQWKVLCLDLKTGDILWERQVHEGSPGSSIHLKNSYASETPVTDGERLLLLWQPRPVLF